jgi:sugar fermentation stimulation protein A
MNFENELISGLFVKRYKRFFVDVIIDKKIVTAHCPNTGSMQGLLIKNNKVWLTKSNDPKRKLKYTLQIIECNGSKVGVNTHLTNKIVLDALKNNKIKNFKAKEIKTEVKFGDNTRFDFLITDSNSKKFIEVKNVTLSRTNKLAEFPDAVTSRGAKHIDELIKAKNKGYDIYLMFVIQRDDCDQFSIARDIDPKYADLLSDAVKKKLNILCYDCKFSPKGIKLNKQIKIKI